MAKANPSPARRAPALWALPRRGGAGAVPSLLRQINVRRVLDALWRLGPASRADLTRTTGISAPTMSKLVATLQRTGLLEQEPELRQVTGRPSTIYRLARRQVQVLGAVIGARACTVLSCGLDGVLDPQRLTSFRTPRSYPALLAALARAIRAVRRRSPAPCLGLGLSVPGLLERDAARTVLCPNIHCLDGRQPGRDLARRTGLETVVVQEEHGLCLAEAIFGAARGCEHFAMVDLSEGLGLGVVSDGRLLTGAAGFGGELGHITVEPAGARCGCGNRGCLETVATDRAFAAAVARRLGRPELPIEELLAQLQAGRLTAEAELARTLDYLAIGLAAVVNLFNPALLLVYGRLFDARAGLFEELAARLRARALGPSFAACRLVRAQGNKRLGAVAAVLHQFRTALGPPLG